jgi:hypothetical protein
MKKIGNKANLLSLIEAMNPAQISTDEFTIADYMKEAGKNGIVIQDHNAYRQLAKLVRDKKITMRIVVVNGRRVNAYKQL